MVHSLFDAPFACSETMCGLFDLAMAPALCLLGRLTLCIVPRRPHFTFAVGIGVGTFQLTGQTTFTLNIKAEGV